jgi:hypothetical protein
LLGVLLPAALACALPSLGAEDPVPLPKPGDKAPLFELPDQRGKKVRLKDVLEKEWVILAFYPKAATPG